MKDFLIIGQGLAGSLLAWELLKRGQSVGIVDDGHKKSSSIISAGIINPVTGKRFALEKDYAAYFSRAEKCYRELEEFFGQSFFEPRPILRMFQNPDELAHWQRKMDLRLGDEFADTIQPPGTYSSLMDEGGSVLINGSASCRTSDLLKSLREYFSRLNALEIRRFDFDDFSIGDNNARYAGETFKNVVFCEGFQAQFNPYFDWLPFNSVKGEILKVQAEGLILRGAILNKGKWALPLENQTWSAGSTYHWDRLDCEPTEEGKKEILDGLRKALKCDINVLDHHAGVRPVMKDQKAVLGRHPKLRHLAIFNGLGSKGFLAAPALADHLAAHLTDGAPLDQSLSLERFMCVRIQL